jgi:hypothetical protein
MTELTVVSRFCGPPGTANGGYLAGRLAAVVGAPAVTVRLRRPTPLDRPLEVRAPDGGLDPHDGVELFDGAELLATAVPDELDLDVPAAPSPQEAAAARAALPPRTGHPFPDCFGCGPARDPDEAVCAVVGPLPDRPEVGAGLFRPTTRLPSADGVAAPETVGAALDCPSLQPAAPEFDTPWLLGTVTLAFDRPVLLDTDHVLLAWLLGREGRRATSASALVGPDGRVCARARAIWFAVPPPSG